MALPASPPISPTPSDSDVSPYTGLGVIGLGLTGLILRLSKDRVVKVAKTYSDWEDRKHMEALNDINREILQTEKSIYDRLGTHERIIHCFKTSHHGIELAFANQGDLETYIDTNAEPSESFKIDWILTLVEALSYIHSRKVFVDEIALRNILVADGRLKFTDFGQSILLPLTADVDTICEKDMTSKIDMLHLGWIIYSIAVWRVCKYYFFSYEAPVWPSQRDLPPTDHLFCGGLIQKCWNGGYVSARSLKEEACIVLSK